MEEYDPKVLAISEVGRHWELPPAIHGFYVAHFDQNGQRTATYVKKGTPIAPMDIDIPEELNNGNFLINSLIIEGDSPLTIVHVYVHPSTKPRNRRSFFSQLLRTLQGQTWIITGDLNDNSKTFGFRNSREISPIADILALNDAQIANDGSITFPKTEASLDVTLGSQDILMSWTTLEDLSSNHLVCMTEIHYPSFRNCQEKEQRTQTDWLLLTKRVEDFCKARLHNVRPNIDILELLELIRSVPQKPITHSTLHVWWNDELSSLKKQRNRARTQQDWTTYRLKSKAFRKAFRKLRKEYREELVREISCTKNPWKLLHRLQPEIKK